MKLRERIANALVGDKIQKLDAATRLFIDAYERQVIPNSPEQFSRQLSELDPHYIDFLVRQLDQRAISGSNMTEQVRIKTVEECRSLYVWDVVTQNIVDLWTDYGFGMSTEITCEDEAANEVWQEFWTAKRNSHVIGERVLKDLSKTLLCDGELFFAFFSSRMDGQTTIRLVPTEEITRIVTDPQDSGRVLYYERQYQDERLEMHTIYYRDWQAADADLKRAELSSGAVIADRVNDLQVGTDVVMLHCGYRLIDGRGWPLMTAGAPWSRAYRNFLQDRAAVARQAAMYNEKIKVKGGQRVIDDIKSRLESSLTSPTSYGRDTNPAAVAGSTWLENEGAERTRMPMGTGASDAEKDGSPLLAQAGLAGRLFPHYLGRGEAFRLATASAMETPIMRAFNRYQQFWASVFRDMVEIVLTMMEKHGGGKYSTYAAHVSTDSVVSVNIADLSEVGNSLVEMTNAGLIPTETAAGISTEIMRVALQTVGVGNVDEIINPAGAAEMAESADQYESSLRPAVYGLWSSKITIEDFASSMQASIDSYLTQAWREGMAAAGVDWADRTQEEMTALDAAILSEYAYIHELGAWIMEHNKASGGLLRDLYPRLGLWVNRWRDIRNRALMMAGTDLPLTWHFGGTEKHCEDCQWANGKTYRASVWEKWGWRPQSPSLSCKGFQCQCELTADGNKPLRGHPKRLVNKE